MNLFNVLVLCLAFLLKNVVSEQHCKPKIISISARCIDRQKVCEELKPCENGGKCTPTGDEQRYKCDCVLGFTGVNCEKSLIKLKVENITERDAVLLVMTSGTHSWAAYLIELTNRKTVMNSIQELRSLAEPGNVTRVSLSSLRPDTSYRVRIKPVESFDQLKGWTNEYTFETFAIRPSFFEVPKKTIYLKLGDNVSIVCKASGIPKPTVEWTGSMLPLLKGRSQQQDGRLNISKAKIQYSGNYTCKASNKRGVIRTTTELFVKDQSCNGIAGRNVQDDGSYEVVGSGAMFSWPLTVYCDMTKAGQGWTLIARFSNNDNKNWMKDSGEYWYDRKSAVGQTTNPADNTDMISPAFWFVNATEFKITRSDDSNHTALLHTTGECLGGQTFRSKTTSYGDFRNSTVWANNKCLGSCDVQYGGPYKSTNGFKQAECDGSVQNKSKIGFWCDFGGGDGAVLMIGGGGGPCRRADHGIGITEADEASFAHDQHGDVFSNEAEYDFGDDANTHFFKMSPYSLNIWVH